jgi:uncharacterized membrane protein YsdA (DUF1294 family)
MMIGFIYLIVVNLVTFFMMGHDKRQARRAKWRVPEKRLFLLAAIGGAVGGWLGMRAWRHKTQHTSFAIGFPLLMVFNAICIFWCIRTFG